MRLIYSNYGIDLLLSDCQANTLVLENPIVFSDFLQELIKQTEGEEGDLILSEGDKVLSFPKNVVLISNPLLVDCNEKRILTKLYKELSDNVKDMAFEEYCEVNAHILEFLERIIETVPYHLDMDNDLEMVALLKAYNVRVVTEEADLLEQIIDYLRAISTICGIRVFVFLNLKQFFTPKQLKYLFEFCSYTKIYLLNLEGHKNYMAEQEKHVIMDEDLCIIASNEN